MTNLTPGKKSLVKLKKAIEYIGDDNVISLYEMQLQIALHGSDEDSRSQAQQFLIDKVTPKPSPATYIRVKIPELRTIDDIKEAEVLILNEMMDEKISLEEGERVIAITKQARNTFETSELARLTLDIDRRMKEKGM